MYLKTMIDGEAIGVDIAVLLINGSRNFCYFCKQKKAKRLEIRFLEAWLDGDELLDEEHESVQSLLACLQRKALKMSICSDLACYQAMEEKLQSAIANSE